MTSTPPIDDLLRKAQAHGQAGELADAERTLAEVLANDPEHARALHLLGVTQWQAGRANEAQQTLQRAATLAPDRAEIHYVLAKVTEGLRGPQAAVDGYARAVQLAPDFAPAWVDLGIARAESGALADAIEALSRAHELQPDDVNVMFALGQALFETGRFDDAVRMLGKANDTITDDLTITSALARALRSAGRSDQALPLLQRLADTHTRDAIEDAALQLQLGLCAHELGRVDEAIAHYRQAVSKDPQLLAAHEVLNRALFDRGERALYLASYREAISAFPRAAALRLAHAEWLLRDAEYESAEKELREAMQLGDASAQAYRLLARARVNQGDTAEALEHFRAAVRAAPDEVEGRRDLTRMLLMLDEVPAALEQVQAALALAPNDQEAVAYQALCWRLLGDEREARINDYTRFVRTYRIAVPEGYDDIAAFNRALNSALDELHSAQRSPPDQTLRGGTQTHGDLFARPITAIEQVRDSIAQCVRAYIDEMDDEADHPLLSRKADDFRFATSWSCRLKQQGYHTNHVHPKGWISSCYYVSLPDEVKHGDDRQGWIQFGESNLRLGEHERIAHGVQPVEGLLVLFPSYMFHGTVPFDSGQARTTIAFDVLPA